MLGVTLKKLTGKNTQKFGKYHLANPPLMCNIRRFTKLVLKAASIDQEATLINIFLDGLNILRHCWKDTKSQMAQLLGNNYLSY